MREKLPSHKEEAFKIVVNILKTELDKVVALYEQTSGLKYESTQDVMDEMEFRMSIINNKQME